MIIEFYRGRRAWLARDKSPMPNQPGSLYLYYKKPEKSKNYWLSNGYRRMMPDFHAYPQIKWEDEEPTEVELINEE